MTWNGYTTIIYGSEFYHKLLLHLHLYFHILYVIIVKSILTYTLPYAQKIV